MGNGEALIDVAERAIQEAGMACEIVESTDPSKESFGDSLVIARVGPLLLRFVRDRGQDFVEMAPVLRPNKYYSSQTVEIGFGWRSLDDVMSLSDLETPAMILRPLVSRLTELTHSFAESRVDESVRRLDAAEIRLSQARRAQIGL